MRHTRLLIFLICFIEYILAFKDLRDLELDNQIFHSLENSQQQNDGITNKKKFDFIYFNDQFKNHTYNQEDILLQKPKEMLTESITCNVQTTPIKEIVCDQNSCTSKNDKLIQVDISQLKIFSVCLTSQQSVIDLSNIQFIISLTQETTIILQANTVKLFNFNINTNSIQQINLNIVSYDQMILNNFQVASLTKINLVSNNEIKLDNITIYSQKVSIASGSDFIQSSSALIGILNSFDLVSGNDIILNKFWLGSLVLPIKRQSDQQQNENSFINIISTNIIKFTNKSEIGVKNTIINLQANQIIISESEIETQSELTIKALDLVDINQSVINSKFAYIYNSMLTQTSSNNSILINSTEINTSGRMCKTSCGNQQNFKLNQLNNQCKLQEYFPYISLLRDSANGQFQVSYTLHTYGLIQYQDLIQIMKKNYTAIIFSLGTLEIKDKSTIIASNLGIYATQITLEKKSVLSSQQMGCQGTKGLGGGIIDIVMRINLKCGGPGGSHGSPGGSPISEQDEYNQLCSQIGSQSIYGNKNDPIFEGSGGGGYVVPPISNDFKSNDGEHLSYTEQYAGSGGGVIYIEAFNITLDGVVDASGGQPKEEYSYLGSGSGGSIQIHTQWMVGSGSVKANGGDRNQQGGEGGGGRIKINMTNWYQMSNTQIKDMSNQNNVQIHVRQGLPKQDQKAVLDKNYFYQNGSFIATPCQPGYQPKYGYFVCEQCPYGFYKNSFNLEQCRPCLNSENSRFDFQVDAIQTSSSCQYTCQKGYQNKMVNHIKACITNGELFVDSLGGSSIIFFVVLLILSILLNLVVICVTKRLNMQKKMQKSIISSNQVDKSKVRLTIEDLPFHFQRFYIEGENTHNKPWVVNDQVKSDIIQIILSGYRSIEQSDLDQLGLLRQNHQEGKNSNDSGFVTYYDYSNNYSYDIELSHDYQQNSAHNTCQKTQKFTSIWDQIKKAFSYSKWEKFILTVLKYLYPYGYYIQGDVYKKQKWKKMKKIMKKFQSDLKLKNSSIRVKFSCTSCYCQAYFDIVDYTKTELQWDIESKMPLCLLLQGKGSFMSPFYLNNRDPLFVLLITYLKSKIDLNYLKCGEMNSHNNTDKNNIFKEWEFNTEQQDIQNKIQSQDQLNDQVEETDQLDNEQIIRRKRKISQIASSLLSRTSTLIKNRQMSKFGSFEMVDVDKDHAECDLSKSEESEQTFCQYNLEEEEDLSYQLILLVECFFNKLNTYSRTICYSLEFSEFRRRFMRFMKFISDHQDIFEIFDMYIQVNIHKIQKEEPKQENDKLEEKKIFFNNFQVFEEEYSSVIILPQKIIPGSVGEKQLETLLQKTYERKRQYNDFEYKISLIFSKEKIYEFNKQYVQKMPTINKQLQWICQSKKNQVKILIQHAEQENQFQELNQNQDKTKKNIDSSQSKMEETFDSNYEVYELKGLPDEVVVVDYRKTPQFERASSSSKNNSYCSKYNRGSTFGKSFNGSDSQAQNAKHNEQRFFLNQSVKEEIEEENKDEKENMEQYNGELNLESGVEQNNGFKQNIKKIINKIILLFSLFKASVLTYRIVEYKILNNNFFLRTILCLFILSKLTFFWFVHIRPFGSIISGDTTVYDNIVITIQASVYPLSSILSAFYQIVWILKQDQNSGKLCMILNTMEIFALIIVIPLQIPQVLLHYAIYQNFILNLAYLFSNLIQGYLGSIYLLQNQEKQIQLCDGY
ncbi:kinase domain protein (macronuclear) [Tetrahymena thermophila SB210]|uniref:Kinase domain protein n=1 Tax=Tetrahymena thermophila (strain SB210) TaxID=312017 RepID=I7LT87_TETTS|nr:kinase domain protein [Tetrahymena thermophila SB210]EAR84795.3 kinase domain protein [Tetrahymena thermophila SB210]|eukprot:XP_001032458.3 kinase domain protein [Tetrahymena thermophila SB210]